MTMQRPLLDALLRGILPTTFIAPRQLRCAEELRALRTADDQATALRLARWALLRGAVDHTLATQLIGEDRTLHEALVRDHPDWFNEHPHGRIRMADEVRRIVLAAHTDEQLQSLLDALLERLDGALEGSNGDAVEHYALEHVAHLLRAHPVRYEELIQRALRGDWHLRQRQACGDGRWTIALLVAATDVACMRHDMRVLELGMELYAQQRAEGFGTAAMRMALRTGRRVYPEDCHIVPYQPDEPLGWNRFMRIIVALHAATMAPRPNADVLLMLIEALPAARAEGSVDANELCSALFIHRVASTCLRHGVDPSPLLRTGSGWLLDRIIPQQLTDDYAVQALHAMNMVGTNERLQLKGRVEIADLLARAGRYEDAIAMLPTLQDSQSGDRARGRIARAMAADGRLMEAYMLASAIRNSSERRRTLLVMARKYATSRRKVEALRCIHETLNASPYPSDHADAVRLLTILGERDHALAVLRQALEQVHPDDTEGIAQLATVCGEMGLINEASAACDRLHTPGYRAAVLAGLVQTLRNSGDPMDHQMMFRLHNMALAPGACVEVRRVAAVQLLHYGIPLATLDQELILPLNRPTQRIQLMRHVARAMNGTSKELSALFAQRAVALAHTLEDTEDRNDELASTVCTFTDLAMWDEARDVAMTMDSEVERRMAHRYLLQCLEENAAYGTIEEVLIDVLFAEGCDDDNRSNATARAMRYRWDERIGAHLARVNAGEAPPVPKPPLRRTPTAEREAWLTDLCTAELHEPGADTQQRLEAVFSQRPDAFISFTHTHPWLASIFCLRLCTEERGVSLFTGLLVANGGDPAVFHRLLENTVDAEHRNAMLQRQHLTDSMFNGEGSSFGLAQVALSSTEPRHLRRRLRTLLLEQWLEFDRKLPGHASALRLLNLQGLGLE